MMVTSVYPDEQTTIHHLLERKGEMVLLVYTLYSWLRVVEVLKGMVEMVE